MLTPIEQPLEKCRAFVDSLMGVKGVPIKAVLTLFFALLTFNASPDNLFSPVDPDGVSGYTKKLSHPFADLAQGKDDVSHESKLNYRIAVPVMLKPFGFDLDDLRWMGFVLALISIFILLRFFERLLEDRNAAFWWTLFFCALPVSGRMFFDGHAFDRFAIFFGIVAMASRHPLMVGLAVFANAWTDERCLLASCWVFVFHAALWFQSSTKDRRPAWCAASVPIAWVGFLTTRYWVWKATGMKFATGDITFWRAAEHINNVSSATLMALETGWLVLIAMIVPLILVKGNRLIALFLLFSIMLSVLSSTIVIDTTRSLAHFWIMLPAIVAVAQWRMPDLWTRPRLRVMGVVLAASLLIPSTECYLLTAPPSENPGSVVHIAMYKPWPIRAVSALLGIK